MTAFFLEQIIESVVPVQILDVLEPPVVLNLAAGRGADPDG